MATTSRLKLRVLDVFFHLGRRLNEASAHRVAVAHTFLELGFWSSRLGPIPDDLPTKQELFGRALSEVDHARSPLYLEFGVFEGRTLQWWSEHLSSADAQLVGFDSFEGLPENWNRYFERGRFDTGGPPHIDDPRVSYQVGWFGDTVPAFELPDHDQLIVNIDSDLYSSAALVLQHFEFALVPGSLLYFDELADRDHELRALQEFLSRSGRSVIALGSAESRNCWLFRITS